MSFRTPLYVLFTLECAPASTKGGHDGPASWELSCRAVEGYCDVLLPAGYPPTLFLDPGAADEHAPMIEELAGRGAEPGVLLHPPYMSNGSYKRNLGQYEIEEQRAMMEVAVERFREALPFAPRSVRAANFSASDHTYQIAYEHGFRQGSVSQPGRDLPREGAEWTGAPPDAHYVDPADRLRRGTLPFLEIPATTDAGSEWRPGIPYELRIENGGFEDQLRPLLEGQLARMDADGTEFRTVCVSAQSRFPYHLRDNEQTRKLRQLVAFLEALRDRYDVVPATLGAAHEQYRRQASVRG